MDVRDVWPLFGLRLITPRLELRPVRDEDLPSLVEAALAGVHDPDRMPFGVPWTDAEPDRLARSMAQYHWRLRADVHPDRWAIGFSVVLDGVPIGIQEVSARDFAAVRTIESGSWITREHQGKGLGTEMRAAALLFAFDELEADWAESSAASWNTPSLRVSERLGYERNGIRRVQTRPGETTDEVRVRVHRDRFRRPDWRMATEGVAEARAQLIPGN